MIHRIQNSPKEFGIRKMAPLAACTPEVRDQVVAANEALDRAAEQYARALRNYIVVTDHAIRTRMNPIEKSEAVFLVQHGDTVYLATTWNNELSPRR